MWCCDAKVTVGVFVYLETEVPWRVSSVSLHETAISWCSLPIIGWCEFQQSNKKTICSDSGLYSLVQHIKQRGLFCLHGPLDLPELKQIWKKDNVPVRCALSLQQWRCLFLLERKSLIKRKQLLDESGLTEVIRCWWGHCRIKRMGVEVSSSV